MRKKRESGAPKMGEKATKILCFLTKICNYQNFFQFYFDMNDQMTVNKNSPKYPHETERSGRVCACVSALFLGEGQDAFR